MTAAALGTQLLDEYNNHSRHIRMGALVFDDTIHATVGLNLSDATAAAVTALVQPIVEPLVGLCAQRLLPPELTDALLAALPPSINGSDARAALRAAVPTVSGDDAVAAATELIGGAFEPASGEAGSGAGGVLPVVAALVPVVSARRSTRAKPNVNEPRTRSAVGAPAEDPGAARGEDATRRTECDAT